MLDKFIIKVLLSKVTWIANIYSSVCLTIFLLMGISCTKTQEVDPNPQDSYLYFPLEVGDYKLYQKVTYSYAVGQKEKIDSALVKETVTSKTTSNSDTYFIIERQAKGKNDLFFKQESVFQIVTNPKQVINGERNIYTVLLHYPIYEGSTWNINEINGQDEQEVEILKPNKDVPANLITNKNIIRVLGDSTNNAITFLVNQKFFAKNIGMIYSEKTEIDYCQDNDENPKSSCTGKGIIESGKREFWNLLEFGKNE